MDDSSTFPSTHIGGEEGNVRRRACRMPRQCYLKLATHLPHRHGQALHQQAGPLLSPAHTALGSLPRSPLPAAMRITRFDLDAVHVTPWVDWVFVHVNTDGTADGKPLRGLGELEAGGLASGAACEQALACVAARRDDVMHCRTRVPLAYVMSRLILVLLSR